MPMEDGSEIGEFVSLMEFGSESKVSSLLVSHSTLLSSRMHVDISSNTKDPMELGEKISKYENSVKILIYKSCVQRKYVQNEKPQVVNTAWAILSLMRAQWDREPIDRGMKVIH